MFTRWRTWFSLPHAAILMTEIVVFWGSGGCGHIVILCCHYGTAEHDLPSSHHLIDTANFFFNVSPCQKLSLCLCGVIFLITQALLLHSSPGSTQHEQQLSELTHPNILIGLYVWMIEMKNHFMRFSKKQC